MDNPKPGSLTKSMHIVYGVSIIVLALVQTAVICAWGNIQIPYVSAWYASTPAATVLMSSQTAQAHARTATTSSPLPKH